MHRSRVEYALTLLARAAGANAERAVQARQELDSWRRLAPVHESAFQEANQRWHALDALTPGLRELLPEPAVSRRRTKSWLSGWRMPMLGGGLAAAVLACAGWYYLVPVFEQDFRTPLAQAGQYDLSDGSTLELNAASAAHVRYFRNRREVVLQSGEARFHVRPQSGQPFRVVAGDIKVTVLGTTFTVGHSGDGAKVLVEEGLVRVDVRRAWWQPDVEGPRLTAGQQVYGSAGQIGEVRPLPAAQVAAWRRGLAVFDDTPLSEALPQLQAWFTTPLQVADAQAGAQRITGTFHLNDVPGALDILPRIVPVSVERFADRVVVRSMPGVR